MPVSKKRMALAVYLDFVVFGAAWSLALHFLSPGQHRPLAQYVLFAILELVLLLLVKWSPGEYMLSISHPRAPSDPIEPDSGNASVRTVVDRRVWSKENFFTVVLGVYLVVEGCKGLVRWTMWTPPQPFFGVRLPPEAGAALAILDGLVHLALGGLVLRLRPSAPLAVTGVSLLQLAAVISSWGLWDDFAREMVLRRRDYQGLPVREGEVELAQLFMPEAAVALLLVQLALVVMLRKRFQSGEAVTGPEKAGPTRS